jgi:hypothetical protein
MLGLFTYIPTILGIPHTLFVVTLLFAIFKNYKNILSLFNSWNQINKTFLIILTIAILSGLNMLLHLRVSHEPIYFPYPIAMIATFLIAISIRRNDMKIIYWLIVIEALIVCLEFGLQTETIIPWISVPKHTSSSLLYFNRPFGLSINSSVAAYKFMVGLLIIDFINYRNKWVSIGKTLLLLGILFTFSRTVIVVLVIYYLFKYAKRYKSIFIQLTQLKLMKKDLSFLIISGIIGATILGFSIINYNSINQQFTKGSGQVELSGREKIWPQFVTFIKSNPIVGNHSQKFYADYKNIPKKAHAHNSFLQVIADNGIIIFLFYALLLFATIKRQNALYISILILYSISQYGIFWGISIIDILLFIFMFQSSEMRTIIKPNIQLNNTKS